MNFNFHPDYDYIILNKGLLFVVGPFLDRYMYWKDSVTIEHGRLFNPTILHRMYTHTESSDEWERPTHLGRGCMD